MTEAVIAFVLSMLCAGCGIAALFLKDDESSESADLARELLEQADSEEQRYHEWHGEPHGESRPRARCREEDLIARGASPQIRLEKHHLGCRSSRPDLTLAFWGEPDLWDALIARVTPTKVTHHVYYHDKFCDEDSEQHEEAHPSQDTEAARDVRAPGGSASGLDDQLTGGGRRPVLDDGRALRAGDDSPPAS